MKLGIHAKKQPSHRQTWRWVWSEAALPGPSSVYKSGMCWESLETGVESISAYFKALSPTLSQRWPESCQGSQTVQPHPHTWFRSCFAASGASCLPEAFPALVSHALATRFSGPSLLKGQRGLRGKPCSFVPSEPGSQLALSSWGPWHGALGLPLALSTSSLSPVTALCPFPKSSLGPGGTRGLGPCSLPGLPALAQALGQPGLVPGVWAAAQGTRGWACLYCWAWMGREGWRALGCGRAALRCGDGGFGEGAGRDPFFFCQSCVTPSCRMDSKAFCSVFPCATLLGDSAAPSGGGIPRAASQCTEMSIGRSGSTAILGLTSVKLLLNPSWTWRTEVLQVQALGRAAVTGEEKRALLDFPLVSSCFSTKHKALPSHSVLIFFLIHFISLLAGRVKRIV